MTRPCWLRRAVRDPHRHAIEQASRRWRGGRRDDSVRTRRKILIFTQNNTFGVPTEFREDRVRHVLQPIEAAEPLEDLLNTGTGLLLVLLRNLDRVRLRGLVLDDQLLGARRGAGRHAPC